MSFENYVLILHRRVTFILDKHRIADKSRKQLNRKITWKSPKSRIQLMFEILDYFWQLFIFARKMLGDLKANELRDQMGTNTYRNNGDFVHMNKNIQEIKFAKTSKWKHCDI